MTCLPAQTEKKLGLVIDLDTCVGCQACVTACKEWNTGGHMAPLTDIGPYGAREFDTDVGVMKKCTLCVDRIYNDNLATEDRVPACVAACPTSARHFGDLGDPASAISHLVEERGGVELMPELGYKPTNKYLPPRARTERAAKVDAPALEPIRTDGGFFGWIDRMLSN
ncbi:MAG: 4Fe-4S dicluster domain-containing protein [Mesorhizobium sp.]|nr:MAG: 4Fe-4S dicluster domain-containing protein [Mesorhizobium sp.]